MLQSTAMSRAQKPKLDAATREIFRALGSIGGKTGGKARWKGVSPEERSTLARKAAQARWSKKGKKKT